MILANFGGAIIDGLEKRNMTTSRKTLTGVNPSQVQGELPKSSLSAAQLERVKVSSFEQIDAALIQAEGCINRGETEFAIAYVKAVRNFFTEQLETAEAA